MVSIFDSKKKENNLRHLTFSVMYVTKQYRYNYKDVHDDHGGFPRCYQ